MDAIRKIEAAEPSAQEGNDLTIAYMAGFQRGKDHAAQTLASKEAELVRLRAALECIAGTTASEHGTTPMMLTRCMKLARAALTQPTEQP